jgi:hypothetical protein
MTPCDYTLIQNMKGSLWGQRFPAWEEVEHTVKQPIRQLIRTHAANGLNNLPQVCNMWGIQEGVDHTEGLSSDSCINITVPTYLMTLVSGCKLQLQAHFKSTAHYSQQLTHTSTERFKHLCARQRRVCSSISDNYSKNGASISVRWFY